MHETKIRWTLNGVNVTGTWNDQDTLLTVLRREFHLCSVKEGCERGECGSCTVLINGEAQRACSRQVRELDGCSVQTWEGLPVQTRQSYSQSLAKTGMACGFCVPGLLMDWYANSSDDKRTSRPALLDILAHHACRCTGYSSWLAVLPSVPDPASKPYPPVFTIASPAGTRTASRFRPSVGAFHLLDRLLAGEPYYVDDLFVPNMLEASMVWCPKAYGMIEQINLDDVLQQDGVLAVLTAEALLYAPTYQETAIVSDTQEISLRLQGIGFESSSSFSMTAWQQELDPPVFVQPPDGSSMEHCPKDSMEHRPEDIFHAQGNVPEISKTLGDEDALVTSDIVVRRESFVGLSSGESWFALPDKDTSSQPSPHREAHRGELSETTASFAPQKLEHPDLSETANFTETWRKEVRLLMPGDDIRWCGDAVGVVVAERREQARQAAKQAFVYTTDRVEPTLDVEYAFQREWGKEAASASWTHGDVDRAFRDAPYVVSGSWYVPAVDAACLELPACLVVPASHGQGCHVYTSGVSDTLVKHLVAYAIHQTPAQVNVTLLPTGGHRGTRSSPWLEVAVARLAMTLKRPVKLALSRQEAIRLLPKRHAMRIHTSLACDEQGKLQGLRMNLLGDAGGLPLDSALVLQRALAHACGPYRIPAFSVEGQILCSNHPHAGQLHEDGIFQIHYALESTLDLLSQHTGIDGWFLRYHNVWQPGDILPQGQRVGAECRFQESLDAIRDLFYKYEPHAGIACAWVGCDEIHPQGTEIRVQLYLDGEGRCHIALPIAESGQGLYVRVLEFVAQAMNLGVEQLVLDISTELASGQSRWSLHESHSWAVMQALQQAIQQWRTAQEQATNPTSQRVFVGICRLPGDLDEYSSLANPPSSSPQDPQMSWCPPVYRTHSFAAQIVVLHPEHPSIQRVITACDVGDPHSPEIVLQQIEGAIYRGLGAALQEQIITEDGMPTATQLSELGGLAPEQLPHLQTMLVTSSQDWAEHKENTGTTEKGGEHVAMMTVAPALTAAWYRLRGKRLYQLPIELASTSPVLRETPPSEE